MSEAKKPRNMSAKGFLHKSGLAKSAAAFLEQHKEWLTTGDLAQFTSPILEKVETKELMPTPALDTIRSIVLGHMLAQDAAKLEAKLSGETSSGGGKKSAKLYSATIYTRDGVIATKVNDEGEEKDLVYRADSGMDASGWVDRRLMDGDPSWFGVVLGPLGYEEIILRNDSISRILRAKTGPSTRNTAKTSSKLSWGMKVSNDTFHFSKG